MEPVEPVGPVEPMEPARPVVRPGPLAVVGAGESAREHHQVPDVVGAHDPVAARVLALTLLVTAAGIGSWLVARGDAWPPPRPVIGLALLLAVAVNRGTFFPTELVATAEAAVLFAAIVGFHADSALLGPLVVALAVGPLDSVHWRQRAFVRMAYNSGSQGLAVLAGAVVFREVSDGFGASLLALVAGGAVAAVPYALVDSGCGVALLLARGGSSFRAAVRHQWSLNGLALPFACAGALAGYLALDVGWWLAILVLVPVPWIPELVVVRARHVQRASARTQVRLLSGGTIVVAFVIAASVAWSSGAPSLPVLVGFAVVLGAEFRVSAARAVPPLAAMVVVAAAVVDRSDALVMAGVVGATTTATAWALARNARPAPASWAIVCAAAGGVACGVVVVCARPGDLSGTAVFGATCGALLFEAVAVVACRSRLHGAAWSSLLWTAPIVLVSVLLVSTWDVLGAWGAVVFGMGVSALLACVACAAAPPWESRVLGPRLGTRPHVRLTAVVVGVAVTAIVLAGAATQVDTSRARTVGALVAASLAETVVGLALVAVRQWRFARAPRARSTSALGVLAAAIMLAYLPLAVDGIGWSVAVLAVVLVATAAIARPVVRLADSVEVAR